MAISVNVNFRMDPDLKRRLKAAAAADEVTVSELVERWATSWLGSR